MDKKSIFKTGLIVTAAVAGMGALTTGCGNQPNKEPQAIESTKLDNTIQINDAINKIKSYLSEEYTDENIIEGVLSGVFDDTLINIYETHLIVELGILNADKLSTGMDGVCYALRSGLDVPASKKEALRKELDKLRKNGELTISETGELAEPSPIIKAITTIKEATGKEFTAEEFIEEALNGSLGDISDEDRNKLLVLLGRLNMDKLPPDTVGVWFALSQNREVTTSEKDKLINSLEGLRMQGELITSAPESKIAEER